MTRLRIALGVLGVAMLGYGVVRLLQFPQMSKPVSLLEWLVAALILHDAILVPLVTGLGWVLARAVPGRARAYLQGGLVVAGFVALLALVLNHRHGHSAPGNALLTEDYLRGGLLLTVLIAATAAAAYAVRVLRDRRTVSRTSSPSANSTDA